MKKSVSRFGGLFLSMFLSGGYGLSGCKLSAGSGDIRSMRLSQGNSLVAGQRKLFLKTGDFVSGGGAERCAFHWIQADQINLAGDGGADTGKCVDVLLTVVDRGNDQILECNFFPGDLMSPAAGIQ